LVVAAPAPGTAAVVPIPDVVGQALDKATANLQMLDLQVGAVPELADPAPAGEVIKQSIKPGTKVAKGQAVDLTVSKGPEGGTETKEPKVPEETRNGTPGEAAAPPQADIHEDVAYAQTHPGKRKFDVTVTVMGRKPGQMVEILMSDSKEINTVVYSRRHDPSDVINQPVYPVGEPTIEIRWEGTLVERYPS
jgi:beta-lactam-binding protein with PASTA domain